MTVEGSEITLAATDGFRISTRRAKLSSPVAKPMSAIIPARALNELARVASDGKQTVHMVVPDGRGQVLFHLDDVELVSQLIDGNFPDYKAIIPQSFKTTTIISTAGFLKACKQAEIIAREGNNVVRLSITAGEDGPGEVEISAQSEETGSSEVQVDATVTGTDLIVAFNVRYLRELLDVVKSASVALETNASNTPGMLRPVGNEDFKHVIMPMHLG
jgi:DNA polymerase-3 subunit beta